MVIARLRGRRTRTRLHWVKGHLGHARNEGADRLASEATGNPPKSLNMEIDPTLVVMGTKLMETTQALAYKAIRLAKLKEKSTTRTRTAKNLDHTAECVKEISKKKLTHSTIRISQGKPATSCG